MTPTRRPLTAALSLSLSVLVVATPAAAHGGDVTAGVPVPLPGWVVLFCGVLGLWAAIAGGVLAADRLLSPLLGTH